MHIFALNYVSARYYYYYYYYPIFSLRVLQEQATKAEKEEKLNKEASSRLLDVSKAKREITEPENQRQRINSPFSAYCAKPTKFDLWKPVPQTAPRFALLTKDFLESVR